MHALANVTPLYRDERGPPAPAEASVRHHLDSVFASPQFDASSRSREFLRYVVTETLAGRGGTLNQTAIAIGVFGRQADFDPALDPIVRVQAGRLRRSLERYYLISDSPPPLRIELRKGSYEPRFMTCQFAPGAVRPRTAAPHRPGLLVDTFEMSAGVTEETAALFTDTLAMQLQRHENVRITRQRDLERLDLEPSDALRFQLCGRLRRRGDELIVSTRLIDRSSAEQLWSDEFSTSCSGDALLAGADHIAHLIAVRAASHDLAAP